MIQWLFVFGDPLIRAPLIGAMLMSLVTSLVGVIVFVRKQAIIGEVLSHAAYPGLGIAAMFPMLFLSDTMFPIILLLSAGLTALVGFFVVDVLESRLRLSSDSACCFVLSFFFGIGVTLFGYVRQVFPLLFRRVQSCLYGQTATLRDDHLVIYASLAILVIGLIVLFYNAIVLFSFDRPFAIASGLPYRLVHCIFIFLMLLSVVIGMRSIGIVLMFAMMVAPASAARQFTNRLSWMFILSGIFAVVSGFFGVLCSFWFDGLPTGPMIVLVAGAIALYSLLCAPHRGLLVCRFRVFCFSVLRVEENLLKLMWNFMDKGGTTISLKEVYERQGQALAWWRLRLALFRLRFLGQIEVKEEGLVLTPGGLLRGKNIIRLHRLWEVYLVNALGIGVERVHKSAEEMEHILTPDLEKQLTELLNNPRQDPHDQPIPEIIKERNG